MFMSLGEYCILNIPRLFIINRDRLDRTVITNGKDNRGTGKLWGSDRH
jgi:hypothetical protein